MTNLESQVEQAGISVIGRVFSTLLFEPVQLSDHARRITAG